MWLHLELRIDCKGETFAMSWFNLNVNESLNTLKGQISNVSHAVHDALAEGLLESEATKSDAEQPVDDDSILVALEAANGKIDELTTQCQSKDSEVQFQNESYTNWAPNKILEEMKRREKCYNIAYICINISFCLLVFQINLLRKQIESLGKSRNSGESSSVCIRWIHWILFKSMYTSIYIYTEAERTYSYARTSHCYIARPDGYDYDHRHRIIAHSFTCFQLWPMPVFTFSPHSVGIWREWDICENTDKFKWKSCAQIVQYLLSWKIKTTFRYKCMSLCCIKSRSVCRSLHSGNF